MKLHEPRGRSDSIAERHRVGRLAIAHTGSDQLFSQSALGIGVRRPISVQDFPAAQCSVRDQAADGATAGKGASRPRRATAARYGRGTDPSVRATRAHTQTAQQERRISYGSPWEIRLSDSVARGCAFVARTRRDGTPAMPSADC